MTAFHLSHAASSPLRRYLALWFPFLPAERQVKFCGLQDEPLVLTGKTGNALRLSAVSRVAAGIGLTPGLTLADARARIPALIAIESDTDGDTRLLGRLAAWTDRFTPLVSLDGGDGLILDITGCAALFGGEAMLRKSAMIQLKRLGFSTKASVAGTPEAAAALARFSRIAIVAEGGDAAAVAPLPVMALGASTETGLALNRAGLKTVGDLATRPSAALASRFGNDLVRRLARICGLENKRLTPLRPLPQCRAVRRFPEPLINADVLEDSLKHLLGDVFSELERRGEGGLTFEAGFFRSDGEVRRIAVETGRASRDGPLIAKLFAERMAVLADPIDPGFGFDAMTLSVLHTARLDAVQTNLEKDQGENGFSDLIDRLTARFGRERVHSFMPEDTHIPERAARRSGVFSKGSKTAWPQSEPDEPPLRPLQMFNPPQPVDAIAGTPDDPPKAFIWRRVQHRLTAVEGPERIAPEWWRGGETLTRDYYRVEDQAGRRFWIYRRGLYERETPTPQWYLHGLFA